MICLMTHEIPDQKLYPYGLINPFKGFFNLSNQNSAVITQISFLLLSFQPLHISTRTLSIIKKLIKIIVPPFFDILIRDRNFFYFIHNALDPNPLSSFLYISQAYISYVLLSCLQVLVKLFKYFRSYFMHHLSYLILSIPIP